MKTTSEEYNRGVQDAITIGRKVASDIYSQKATETDLKTASDKASEIIGALTVCVEIQRKLAPED